MIARAVLLVLGLVTALLLGTAGVAPASADDELGLSHDGVTYTDGSLTRPLFDPQVRWVPGDVRTARFFVRNQALTTGRLGVELLRAGRDGLLESGFLEIAAQAGDGPWTTVRAGDRLTLVDDVETRSGAVVPVRLRVGMDFSAPNDTMLLATDLDLRVTLAQDVTAVLPDGGTSGGDDSTISDGGGGSSTTGDGGTGGGLLPATGSPLTWWLALLTLLLLSSGSFFLTLRRTADDDDLREARP